MPSVPLLPDAKIPHSSFEYPVRSILAEKGSRYVIDWEDSESTGEKYSPSWEPKENANQEAVNDWERKQRKHEKTKAEDGLKGWA